MEHKTRNSLVAVGLMCTTALVPVEAKAMPPVVAFATTVFAGGGLTAAFAASAATLGITSALGVTLYTLGVSLVVGIGLLKLAQALMPKPQTPDPSNRMVNYAQPLTFFETVYGRARKGGPLAYTNFGDNRRHVVILFCGHKIASFDLFWLDEWLVSVDDYVYEIEYYAFLDSISAKTVSSSVFYELGTYTQGTEGYDAMVDDLGLTSASPTYITVVSRSDPGAGVVSTTPPGSLAQIHTRLGTVPQTLLPCVSKFPELTPFHDFAGLAVAELVAQKPSPKEFNDNYPRGREWVLTSLIAGRDDILDPRTDTVGFTDNAALVIAHWITYYMNKTVDWTEVAEEADACDVIVDSRYDGTQRKWTLNGVFSDNEDDEVIRAQLGLSCDAFFYERPDGSVGFKVGRYYEPTEIITDDDFYSLTLSDGENALDTTNETVINYVEQAREWRENASGPWVHDPEGRRTRDTVPAYFINTHNQAVRVAKRISRAQHAEYTLRGVIKYVGHQIVGERFIRVIHTELGVNEVFEVQSLTRSEDGMSFTLEAVSVTAEDFEFDHTTEEPQRPDSSESDELQTNYDPSNIVASSSPVSGVPAIAVTWDSAFESLSHIVRWAPSGTTDWTYSDVISPLIYSYLINPLVDGLTYDVQVAAVGGVTGRLLSGYLPSPALSVSVISNPTAPLDVVTFDGTYSVDGGRVEITLFAPNDPNYYATRIYRNTVDTFESASLIDTEYGAPNSSDKYYDTNIVGGLTYFYWGVPINSSGVAGNTTPSTSVTIP
jgi:hypothetical protein